MKKNLLLSALAIFAFFTSRTFAQVPALSSNPGALSVLLIDMDGHTDSSGWWGGGIVVAASPNYSSAQATEIFNRVSEDFRPFDINVTTQQSVFNAAPIANRQRVVITPTDGFYNVNGKSAGGVAFLGTFGGGNVSCWVFSNKMGGSVANAAEAASHELGHTLGLNHHARYNSNCSFNTEYHNGQGSGQTSWAPIMGVGYGRTISQWYYGPANSSLCTSNIQDDLAIITTNGFDYRTDDVGNTQGTATTLSLVAGTVSTTKIISTNTDVDVFKITIPADGVYTLSVTPYAQSSSTFSGANLDSRLTVRNSGGSVLADLNPVATLDASGDVFLTTGDYYLTVDGSGVPNYIAVGGVGSQDYGSIGQYSLSATLQTCTAGFASITSVERCGTGTVTLSVVPTSGGTVSWYSASTAGTLLTTGNSYLTPSNSSSNTYYVEVTDANCTSKRAPVNANISVAPVLSAISGPTTVQIGNTIQLTQTYKLGTWGTSDPNKATVSASGLVTGIAAGSVQISYSATVGSCPMATVNYSVSVTAPGPCPGTPTVTDVEGNVYNTIQIGTQCWTKENLKTSKFADNSSIPGVPLNSDWTNLSTGAWANYGNDNLLNSTYGKLYNFYAVTDSRAVCPAGWHMPDQNEYYTALNFLGGVSVAGGKLKSTSGLWNAPNTGATDFSGFSGLPGGQRLADGSFSGTGTEAGFWTVSTSGQNGVRYTLFNDLPLFSNNYTDRKSGQAVRCVQNPAGSKAPTIQYIFGGSSCGPAQVYLNAYASAGFVNWYTTSTGGTPFYTGNSYQTPILQSSTTYYVEAVYGVQVSNPRSAVTATIKPLFSSGSLVSADETLCSGGDPSPVSFGTSPVSADSILYQWYYKDGLVVCPTGSDTTGWIRIHGAVTNSYNPPSGLTTNRTYAVLVTPTFLRQGQGEGSVGGGGAVCGSATWATGCRKITLVGGPDLTSLDPAQGAISSSILLLGTGLSNVTTVKFNELTTTFKVNSANQITAAVPAGATNGYVVVINSNGCSDTITGFQVVNQVCATPTASPVPGTYGPPPSITLTTTTSGATIYYTTNGTLPGPDNAASRIYTVPFQIAVASATVKARAFKNGFVQSAPFSGVYNVTNICGAITITPGTGTYFGSTLVTMTCPTVGATIYYSTSGNVPVPGTTFTKVYTSPFYVNSSVSIRAYATKTDFVQGPTALANLTISTLGVLPNVVFTPPAGTYLNSQSIALSCTEPGTTIYYTTNGNAPLPGTGYTLTYTGPFTQFSSGTIKAFASKLGYTNGAVGTAVYTITNPAIVATPVFSPLPGACGNPCPVTITCTTPGAAIWYTTTGNTPDPASPISRLYSTPVSLTTTTTLKAKAFLTGYLSSATATGIFTITPGREAVAEEEMEPTEGELSIYPNPSSGSATLTGLPEEGRVTIRIWNSEGKQVSSMDRTPSGKTTELDLRNFASGLYQIEVLWEGSRKQVRMIKN
jgi:uncharacterized protein (TIGR02145 family)